MIPKVLAELPINNALLLDNVTCPYCGVEITKNNNTKEHVIGRRFVPKGSLDGQWNLIVRACRECNKIKSDFENDISAITLAGRLWFNSGEAESSILSEAQRKAKSCISRKTGKPVMHSHEKLDFEVPLAPEATLKFNFVSPPQLDSTRLFQLARMQVMAFFYLITYDQETKKGGYWLGGFHPLLEAHHADWGNTIHMAFMKAVGMWESRWVGNTANGFFKSIIRRHPHEICWSWALEWNNNYRLIGFFGEREPAQAIVRTFPSLEMNTVPTGEKLSLRFRQEVGLSEQDDSLFVWHDGEADDGNV